MKGLGLVRFLWITAGPNGHKVLLLELGGKNQGPRRHGGVHRGNSVIQELQEAGGSGKARGKLCPQSSEDKELCCHLVQLLMTHFIGHLKNLFSPL